MSCRLMVFLLLPIMLLLGAHSATLVASEAERAEHFDTVKQLIDREFLQVATRALAAFEQARYPDPGNHWRDGLRYHYANTFSLVVGGERAEQLAAQARELQERLRAVSDALPEPIAEMVRLSGQVQRIAQRINQMVNPDSPPPLVPFNQERLDNLKSMLQQLMEVAARSMAEQTQTIAAFQPEVDRAEASGRDFNDRQYREVIQKATFQRFEQINSFYTAYKPLRELLLVGETYGLTREWIEATIRPWVEQRLTDNAQDYEQWEWVFADYYPYLRHRLSAMLGEMWLMNWRWMQQQDLERPTAGADRRAQQRYSRMLRNAPVRTTLSYDDIVSSFFGVIDFDISDIRDRQSRQAVERLKLEAWSDLLYWHLNIGEPAELERGLAFWQDLRGRIEADRNLGLDARDQINQVLVGHLYMLASRLLWAAGDSGGGNELMVKVSRSGNFFAGNARQWIAWQAERQGAGNWFQTARARDPETSLSLGRALMAEARVATDEETADRFMIDAASALRDGILGLPARADDPVFVEHGPALYQALGFVLFRQERFHQALAVVIDGLDRFLPERWGANPSADNPYFRAGRVTPAGAMVRRVGNDAMSYAQTLLSRTGSGAARNAFQNAIERLRVFDPESVQGSTERINIVNLIHQGDYDAAIAESQSYAERQRQTANDRNRSGPERIKAMEEWAWALRMRTHAQFQKWDALISRNPEDPAVQTASQQLQEYVEALAQVVALRRDNWPESTQREFDSASRQVTTVTIARLFREEEHEQVLMMLDEDFWEKVPNDEGLVSQLLSYMAGAAFQVNNAFGRQFNEALRALPAQGRQEAQAELIDASVARMLELWPHFIAAANTYNRQLRRFPALETTRTSIRRQLAAVFNVATSLSDMMRAGGQQGIAPWLGGRDLSEIDPDLFAALAQRGDGQLTESDLAQPELAGVLVEELNRLAKEHFADLYLPIARDNPDERIETVLAVAGTLWELDRKVDAAVLYERYRREVRRDPQVLAFQADPRGVVDAAKEKLNVRVDFQPFWQGRGAIPDLLIDAEGFIENEYLDPSRRLADLSEEKRSFNRALQRVDAFAAELEARRGLLPNQGAAEMKVLQEFRSLVEKLAISVQVDGRLMQAYRETGRLAEAVELARELYAYDPLEPDYMAVVVDGTLQAAKEGPIPTAEEMDQARQIAARMRQIAERAQDRFNFWIASCQILELSALLSDTRSIGLILANYNRQNRHPATALAKPMAAEAELGSLPDGYGVFHRVRLAGGAEEVVGYLDRSDMQLIQRFIGLYALEGATARVPLVITEKEVADPDDPLLIKTIHIVRETERGE